MFSSSRDLKNAGADIGFRGCFKKFTVNDKKMNLRYPGPNVIEQRNVVPSCGGTSPCSSKPCLNNGLCIVTSARSYQCRCAIGFIGARCEERGT